MAAALTLIGGGPIPAAAAMAALAIVPSWFVLAGVATWVAWHRLRSVRSGPAPDDEADVLRGLAAELAAGASVRAALRAAAERSSEVDLGEAVRVADAGLPIDRVAAAVEAALPVNGRVAAAALRLSAETGAPMAAMAADLAVRSSDEGRLRRERRALTAQARASAAVVAGVPALLVVVAALGGRLRGLLGHPWGGAILGLGIGLQAAGIVVVWLMTRGATR